MKRIPLFILVFILGVCGAYSQNFSWSPEPVAIKNGRTTPSMIFVTEKMDLCGLQPIKVLPVTTDFIFVTIR